jgi:hypothetical protein
MCANLCENSTSRHPEIAEGEANPEIAEGEAQDLKIRNSVIAGLTRNLLTCSLRF